MEKYFRISRSKEHRDIKTLIKMLKPIITEDTVICNCSPDYSSIISQQVAHSYFDNPIETIPFQMPFPNTPFEKVYNAHCRDFVEKLEENTHYIFIDSGILRGRNFKTLYDNLMMYTNKSITFDFACLYSQDDAIFKAEYCVQYFNKQKDGMLLFYWENEKCTLFD